MGFTQPDDAMPGRMGLVKGASTCIIRVTSRRKSAGPGQIRVKRSIWVFAEGGKLCIQQKRMRRDLRLRDVATDVPQYPMIAKLFPTPSGETRLK